jgi:hypothetical protein
LSSPLLDDDDDDLHSFVSLTLQISRVGPFLLNERTQNTQDQKEMKALPHTRRDSNNHSKRRKKKKKPESMHLHLCLMKKTRKKKKKKKKVKAKIDSKKTAKRRSIIFAKRLQIWMPE